MTSEARKGWHPSSRPDPNGAGVRASRERTKAAEHVRNRLGTSHKVRGVTVDLTQEKSLHQG